MPSEPSQERPYLICVLSPLALGSLGLDWSYLHSYRPLPTNGATRLGPVSTEREKRFDKAFDAWRLAPVERVATVPSLDSMAEPLTHVQDELEPFVTAYRKHRMVMEPPWPGLWHDGISFQTERPIKRIRAHLHTGRNQLATRELLHRVETLKSLWDAYRAATRQ